VIKGVILGNFMSYSNAEIPLYPGLNLVCGPNGAGKSSILLAISLVLGQAHTERAKRLSDLIRWGEDHARIGLLLDNSPKEGKRPFPQYRTDTIDVTRILRRGGDYGYLLLGKPVSKERIVEIFSRIGLNPNNMLIIMHQLMVGRFALISPREKLLMLEEAVGFQSYRADIMDANARLKKSLSEEESLAAVLESTQETYQYWKKEYEKYQKKKELERKLQQLQCELLWGRIEKKQTALAKLDDKITSKNKAIESMDTRIDEDKKALQARRDAFNNELKRNHQSEKARIELERKVARAEADVRWVELQGRDLAEDLETLSRALSTPEFQSSNKNVPVAVTALVELGERLKLRKSKLEKLSSPSSFKELEANLTSLVQECEKIRRKVGSEMERLIEYRVQFEVLILKRKLLSDECRSLLAQRRIAKQELNPLIRRAERLGPKPGKTRKITELEMAIVVTEEELRPLTHVSEEVEKMYSSYVGLVKDLREKAERVAKNREETLRELAKRFDMWKTVVGQFLAELSERYNTILSSIGASGAARLVEAKDVEKAGLELLVSFKGGKMGSLDSLAQSGGERSVALMAFLLTLQQHIKSPFRAIDEFDVHLDPKNREMVSNLIVASFKEAGGEQYLAITPGEIGTIRDNMHVVVVQNVSGTSEVSEVK